MVSKIWHYICQQNKRRQLWLIIKEMITIQDLYNIVVKKVSDETQKTIIRNNFPPQIAERMCSAIDRQENTEHFMRLLNEYNEWMVQQQRQHEAVIKFLRQYRS